MAAPEDLAGRYPPAQVAKALNLDADWLPFAVRGGDAPDGAAPEELADATAAAARLRTALADAGHQAAAAVGQRFDRAAAEGAPELVRIEVDLAMRDLHGDDVPEDIEARWHAARKDLRMIASGERALLGANGAPVAELGRVLVHQGETTFDAETLEGFLHPSLDSPAGPHRTGRC